MPAISRCSSTSPQLEALERRIGERGYLEGKKMATAFNMLRSNDLIWPYVVNNYLRGKAPMPFDLFILEFGCDADAGRKPFVLSAAVAISTTHCQGQDDDRQCQNRSQPSDGAALQSRTARTTSRGKSAFLGSKVLRGPVKFVLSASGHIAGVVNRPIPTR